MTSSHDPGLRPNPVHHGEPAAPFPPAPGPGHDQRPGPRDLRQQIETKISTKTTELIAYVVAVLAVIITASVVGGDNGSPDPFGASEALRYITWLTIGYMVARGLAKSGSPATGGHDRQG
ncbi:hypothetical protein [Williamsia serinedens]|uniref:Uncharacterized protein n=1 Tax=Williamsia serinedens TaxID=391736 RepID=A0ABT1H152_9NOCA|nr:hypothetical protein [Williamsia serinedens]MCP2160704.1 hypothetical protein [Williamsia serinedens]